MIVAAEEFAARKKAEAFASAVKEMAADPEIRDECIKIAGEFQEAETDGLPE